MYRITIPDNQPAFDCTLKILMQSATIVFLMVLVCIRKIYFVISKVICEIIY